MCTLKVISVVQLARKILQIMSFLVLHDAHSIFKAMKSPAVNIFNFDHHTVFPNTFFSPLS